MRTSVFLCLYAWLVNYSHVCLAGDTLNVGDRITGNETTLVSAGKNFELGFFSPSGNSTYLGIWYHGLKGKTFVWVANRDNPIVGSEVVLKISEDGNLKVLSPNGNVYWSSELKGSLAANRTVMLMDSGNLVLRDDHLGNSLWQSFEHPTDTFLPGMKMDEDMQLTSWRASDDPGPGNFTFSSGGKSYIISKDEDQLYWEGEIPGNISYFLTNFTFLMRGTTFDFNYNSTRLLMNATGQIQLLTRVNSSDEWSIKWEVPNNPCKINGCGNFSSCNNQNEEPCKCLPGFSRISSQGIGDYGYHPDGEGCVRMSEPCRENITFLKLNVTVRKPDQQSLVEYEEKCETLCRNMCSKCQAYSSEPISYRNLQWACQIWTNDLTSIQEEDLKNGQNLFVRVDTADIELTPRTCEPCGPNIIPYPLSTNPTCGDPMYYNFRCESTGNLTFMAKGLTYRVIGINQTERKFYIKTKNTYCDLSRDRNQQTDFSFPFKVDKVCYAEEELGVIWQPPQEPICRTSSDCQRWGHSTCNADATGIGKCLCDKSYGWNGSILSCTPQVINGIEELQPTSRKNSISRLTLILVVVVISITFLASLIISLYVWKKKMAHKQDREGVNRIQGRMFDSERQVKDLIDLEGLEERDNEGIGVPYFDFETILEATDNFSDANKLGQGGYGPVYKGKLQGGQEIAVKRLSSVSSQGLQEFKNEVVLIAKLQHRNLVRVRGYCIKGDEKILLYEFMPNKSLNTFIFDPTKSVLLDWPMRFDIILGIARGLVYLHQDSRLRIIHRDLKTSNILLDEEMQPKISDFGLARIFANKEIEANTERVVGTYGYMSPEYALDGLFSIKSDVFSFGIVVLEIISGKQNTGFYQSGKSTSLLSHAWRLWTENKLLDLMDSSLQETGNTNQFIRCAQVSLLCVQDEPGDRPTMSNVLTMLNGETTTPPNPKQPTFFKDRDFSSTASSSSKPEISMQTDSIYGEGR